MGIVFLSNNPIGADEYVYLTDNPDRADEFILARPTPYKVERTIYLVFNTSELRALFDDSDPEKFRKAASDLRRLKLFDYRHAGVPRIDKVVCYARDEAQAREPVRNVSGLVHGASPQSDR